MRWIRIMNIYMTYNINTYIVLKVVFVIISYVAEIILSTASSSKELFLGYPWQLKPCQTNRNSKLILRNIVTYNCFVKLEYSLFIKSYRLVFQKKYDTELENNPKAFLFTWFFPFLVSSVWLIIFSLNLSNRNDPNFLLSWKCPCIFPSKEQ